MKEEIENEIEIIYSEMSILSKTIGLAEKMGQKIEYYQGQMLVYGIVTRRLKELINKSL